MVTSLNSGSRGPGFNSQHQILDGHFHFNLLLKLCCLFEKIEDKIKVSCGRSIWAAKKKEAWYSG